MATVSYVTDKSREQYLNSTTARLYTYANCPKKLMEWPRNGFVYDESNDSVQCADCKKSVIDWRETDSADKILRLHKEGCHFLKITKPEANDNSDDEVMDGAGAVAQQSHIKYELTVDLSNSEEHHHREPSRLDHLKAENKRMKKQMTCRICNKAQVGTLFLPCRHLVSCEECAEAVDNCTVCNVKILGTVRTFLN